MKNEKNIFEKVSEILIRSVELNKSIRYKIVKKLNEYNDEYFSKLIDIQSFRSFINNEHLD